MTLFLIVYVSITIGMLLLWVFSDAEDSDFLKFVLLWPILLLKELLKALFKLLFTDWK